MRRYAQAGSGNDPGLELEAGDRSRTRDLKFAKLVLYQLSYTRVALILGVTCRPINRRRIGPIISKGQGGILPLPRFTPPMPVRDSEFDLL